MDMGHLFHEDREVVDDAFKAYTAIAIFFDTEDFLASKMGRPFKKSMLLNQKERFNHVPDRRTHLSNTNMPKEFWDDWDEPLKNNSKDFTRICKPPKEKSDPGVLPSVVVEISYLRFYMSDTNASQMRIAASGNPPPVHVAQSGVCKRVVDYSS
ncbi:hypothetical protein EJ02DRAFT_179480 [Clathrospora elynae]|uniref:Uncharacterized protein n=1 Tax=Clathrospora elynae TaxID=706981 RepID=A0A6A5SRI3_9PLEO|nr:hypothetical protein EJ02DRAFT_179480 [Clathrospora elynae]